MREKRCFVVGLDGGSWNVIRPLLEARKLPNLEALLRTSSWGTLRSTVPPVTCPAWLTFSTGLKPSRLGIYDFWSLRPGTNEVCVHTYAEVRQTDFWDLLGEHGVSCGIVNNPLLYPRGGLRGYVVPGFLTPRRDFRTLPADLLGELHRAVGGYEVDQWGMNVVDDQTMLEDCLRVARKRVRALAYLLEKHPTDFFLGVFTSTDRVCHRFLNRAFMGTGKEKEEAWEAITAVYRTVDEGIGLVVEKARDEDLLVVVSDHGFAPRSWNFHINQFLAEAGLLAVRPPGRLERMGLTQRDLARRLSRLGMLEWAMRWVPERWRSLIPRGATNLGEYPIHDLIARGGLSWERTKALSLGYGVYLNGTDRPRGTVEGVMAEAVRSAIREGLGEMAGPAGPLRMKVLDPQEAYRDPHPLDPPDLIVVEEGDYQLRSTLDVEGRMFSPNRRAGHSMEGIVVVRPPGGGACSEGLEASIEDLAGMFLRFHGVPVPPHMESSLADRVIPLDHSASRGSRGVRVEDGEGVSEEERIRQRIKELRARGLV